MHLTKCAVLSRAVRHVNAPPTLVAAELGGPAFVDFLAAKAQSFGPAMLIVRELKAKKAAGYQLDSTLQDILRIAEKTVQGRKTFH